MKLTYCSFAEPDRSLGVLILEGHLDPLLASLQARLLGANPGGELFAMPVPDDLPDLAVYEANRNRLIPPAEARELFEAKSIREHEEEEAP